MMGMGEPLLNLPEVMKATRLLADREGVGIPLKRITVSTSGITPKIEEFAAEAERPSWRCRSMPRRRRCGKD